MLKYVQYPLLWLNSVRKKGEIAKAISPFQLPPPLPPFPPATPLCVRNAWVVSAHCSMTTSDHLLCNRCRHTAVVCVCYAHVIIQFAVTLTDFHRGIRTYLHIFTVISVQYLLTNFLHFYRHFERGIWQPGLYLFYVCGSQRDNGSILISISSLVLGISS